MSFGTRIPSLAALLLATSLLFRVTEAHAADSDAQIAQTLFDVARVLLDAGRYAEACPSSPRANGSIRGGGTLLNLALCHEREGKTATAWLEFREALGQAERDRRDDRIAFAREHIAGLEPILVKVSIIVPESLSSGNLEIQLETSHVPREAWRTALPVDPGEHRVVANRSARRGRRRSRFANRDARRKSSSGLPPLRPKLPHRAFADVRRLLDHPDERRSARGDERRDRRRGAGRKQLRERSHRSARWLARHRAACRSSFAGPYVGDERPAHLRVRALRCHDRSLRDADDRRIFERELGIAKPLLPRQGQDVDTCSVPK